MRNTISDYRFQRFEERVNEEYGNLDRRVRSLEVENACSKRTHDIDGYTSLDSRIRSLENSDRWNRVIRPDTCVTTETPPRDVHRSSTYQSSSTKTTRTYNANRTDDFTKYESFLKPGRMDAIKKRWNYEKMLFEANKQVKSMDKSKSSETKDEETTPAGDSFDELDTEEETAGSATVFDAVDGTDDSFLSLLREIRMKSEKIMEILQRNARDIVECKAIAARS